MREFKVGDKVRIRQWDDMAKEFEVNQYGDIVATYKYFSRGMEYLCGRKAIITKLGKDMKVELEFEDATGSPDSWSYSTDMIEPVYTKADLKLTDIVKYKDGTYNMILPNEFSGDGLGMFRITAEGVGCCSGYLSYFEEDLTYSSPKMRYRDIVAVYGEPVGLRKSQLDSYFHHGTNTNLPPLIWEREEKVKELTSAEAAALLKDKFADFDEIKIVV